MATQNATNTEMNSSANENNQDAAPVEEKLPTNAISAENTVSDVNTGSDNDIENKIEENHSEGNSTEENISLLYKALCVVSYDVDEERVQTVLKELQRITI